MPEKYKIAVHGTNGSGKSQLFRRLLGQDFRDNHYTSPLYKTHEVNQQNITVQYWDFPTFDAINHKSEELEERNSILCDAHKIVITFDASQKDWQDNLTAYLRDIRPVMPPISTMSDASLELPIPVILVGTKVDLLTEAAQKALEAQAKAYARETWGTECYMAVSAKTGLNVDKLQALIIHDLLNLADVAQEPLKKTASQDSHVRFIDGIEKPAGDVVTIASPDDLPSAHIQDDMMTQSSPAVQQPAAGSAFSFALRMAGLALMVAAVVNLAYLALVAANILSAVALTTAISHVVATAGGILGVTAPAVAFANACAAWGISTTAATAMIDAASTMLVGLAGYGVFRCGKPATATQDLVNNNASSRVGV